MTAMVRVELPESLRVLARIAPEIRIGVEGEVTIHAVLDALEAQYPMLLGTIRDRTTQQRRAFIRFFACQEDFSHTPPDAPLPASIAHSEEVFMIVGAIAGG